MLTLLLSQVRLLAAVRENEPSPGEDQRPELGDGGNRAYYCLYYTSDWFKHQILRNLFKSCMYILKFFVF